MYTVYVVEDDEGIATGIVRAAEPWGLTVRICRDFTKVTEEFAAVSPHIVLLDIGLPFAGGYHWCDEIRKISHVPIIFISSASDAMNVVMAMNHGADDFIAKPFDANVLMAKMQALLRRTYDFGITAPVLAHRGAFLETADSVLMYGEKRIELTKNEYRILLCLLENKGKTVSREKLMERLWETDSFIDENTLTVNVARLRKKLDAEGLDHFISTRSRVGYIVE